MKSKPTALIYILPILCCFQCVKPSKVLPKKNGTWNVTETYNGQSAVGPILFFAKDGSGTYTSPNHTSNFQWSYVRDGRSIELSYDNGHQSFFTVKIRDRDYEEWEDLQTSGFIWELRREK